VVTERCEEGQHDAKDKKEDKRVDMEETRCKRQVAGANMKVTKKKSGTSGKKTERRENKASTERKEEIMQG
jgi:hypothetical protein